MDTSFEVSDPSDWLQTSVKQLAAVETSLRCQVCKDFFDTPMITSCSHTFCSLCIRRCLTSDGKCPTCRTADQELRLRMNWALEETVQAFQNARPALIGFNEELRTAREENELRGSKRKLEEICGKDATVEGEPSISKRKTRSQSQNSPEIRPAMRGHIPDSETDDEYQPDEGLTACPICNKRMKEEEVFPHLDVHNEPASATKRRAGSNRETPIEVASRSRPPPKPMDRLPQISYGLMKDQALRKKLADLGIPNTGPRPLLMKRHTEWVNLVNSNCDSSKPRSKRNLLSELDTWERSQGRNILTGLGGMETSSVMRKDFDGAAWANTHGNNFQQLIAKARQKPKPKQEDEPSADQDGADASAEARTTTSEPPHIPSGTSQPPASTISDIPAILDASRQNGALSKNLDRGIAAEVIDLDSGG